MNDGLFYVAACWLIISSVSVALSPYPVRSVLSLISAFVATAVLWLGIGAEFLALALVFVYVGAVMALFLFIVFMINIDHLETKISMRAKSIMVMLLGLSLGVIFWKASRVVVEHNLSIPYETSNTKQIGIRLFQRYWLEFEYVGFILLSAMIAAIALVSRENKTAKYQDTQTQMDRRVEDCITWMDT
jgi:NADH-quinone oxidoreductase subunit J